MRRWVWVAGFFASWVILGGGCEKVPTHNATPSGTATGLGGGPADAGDGDSGLDASTDGGGLADGGLDALRLALVANPPRVDATEPSSAEEVEAELTAFAAGVRAVSLDVPWDELDAEALASRVAGFRQRGLGVLVNLMVVDDETSHLPDALAGQTWDAPATVAALESALAQILAAAGTDIDALILGRGVDRYLAAQPAEGDALESLLGAGMASLAQAPDTLQRAVGLGFVAVDPPAAYVDLASLGTVVALSYLPGLGEPSFPTQTSAPKDLDGMIALAAGRKIVLTAIGYPSATSLGSSVDTQALQLEAFFSALAPRRTHFRAVTVHMLHDAADEGCVALLASRGIDAIAPLADHLCSLGLRDELGEPKPAWQHFLAAAAHYASP